MILCDVAREDASVILGSLRELGIHQDGSIAIEMIDTALSDAAREAEKAAGGGLPSDAVVWEEVEERTSESAELSVSFLAFMALSMLIAAEGVAWASPSWSSGDGRRAGVRADRRRLRGPHRRPRALARRSIVALAVGFPFGIVITYLATLLARTTGVGPEVLADSARPLTAFVSHLDAASVIVAYLAGTAGILSLASAKSGALVGVLISVTTIPAPATSGWRRPTETGPKPEVGAAARHQPGDHLRGRDGDPVRAEALLPGAPSPPPPGLGAPSRGPGRVRATTTTPALARPSALELLPPARDHLVELAGRDLAAESRWSARPPRSRGARRRRSPARRSRPRRCRVTWAMWCETAAAARITAIGLALFVPSRPGAVPCGASMPRRPRRRRVSVSRRSSSESS